MNFQFPKLYLTEPPQLQATNLLQLVSGDPSPNQSQNLDIPLKYIDLAKPPRSINEIITDIENQAIKNITPLEWIYCLSFKETWDTQQPTNRTRSTSRTIWRIAKQQSYAWLKYRLFYRLAYFYDENSSSFTLPRSLAETFSSFEPTNGDDVLVVRLLQALQSSQPDRQLAELSFRHLQTPQTLFIQNRLPYQLLAVKRALNHVIFPFLEASSHDSDRVSWLLDCFDEMDREPQLQAVENLLNSQISDRPIEIANWLKNNYGLGVINSRWHELSQEAKIKLRQWIGAINYQNFDDFINLLIERLDLNEKQENQLIKRKEFWSNYSNKFERINMLLPLESATTLNMNTDSIEFIILENDGNDLAEICIFDFGDKIIIEFFRGRVSETRLLDKTSQLESDLFDNKRKLSITYLRSLGGKVHDHVFCWQYYCERWLAQHNIFPNEGIKQFKVSPNKYNRYSIEQGLPKPSFHDMQERQEQEQRWLEKINRLE
jgi:hypothetical protein